jgi:hypothetical protein
MKTARFGCLGSLLACLGCLDPAADNAKRDEAVGQASDAGLDVSVEGGLAAVRHIDEGQLRLWENAPTLDLRIRSQRVPRSLELVVDNCMPAAVLGSRSGQVTIEPRKRPWPTSCRFSLQLASVVSELRLADPAAEEPGTFHFGVMSDVQTGIDTVHQIYARINQLPRIAFVLGIGDLTEEGTVPELQRFQAELRHLNVPYYVTLGNHELGTTPPPYHDYFGRGSSSYVFRGVRFTLLDSAEGTVAERAYEWLDDWLARGRSSVHVAAMHIPPFDHTGIRNGSFVSRNEAAALLGKLAGAGVDLTLYGHVHSYRHFVNAGIDAHISGGGGATPEPFDTTGRHFLDVTVAPTGVQRVDVVRVDE